MDRQALTALAVLVGLLYFVHPSEQQSTATTISGSTYTSTNTLLPFAYQLYSIPTPIGKPDPDVLVTLDVQGNGLADVYCNPGWGQYADPLAPPPQPGLSVWSADESAPVNQIWISRNDPQYRPPYARTPSQPGYTSYYPSFLCLVLNVNAAASTTYRFTVNLITNNNVTLNAIEQTALANIYSSCCPLQSTGACTAWKAVATNQSDGTSQPFTNFCTFTGQICSADGRLQRLDMTGYGLQCPFPADQFSKFTGLHTLSLPSNPNLTGSPSGVFDSLVGATSLQRLDLSGNTGLVGNLTGSGANTSICTLAKASLETLTMESAGLQGTLPACLLAQGSKLAELDLGYNNLTGSIPDVVPTNATGTPALELLVLNRNNLTGTIPASLTNAQLLTTVDLSNNMLMGSLPSLGAIPPLSEFVVEYNRLTGSVPDSFASAPNLRIFDVKANNLTGLPAAWVNPAASSPSNSSLTIARLSFNNFTGSFPQGFQKLPLLQFLILNSNNFSGPLLTSGNPVFPSLRALNASYNHFTGSIPVALGQSGIFTQAPLFAGQNTVLQQVFDLSHNRLTGTIPSYLNYTQVPIYVAGGVYLGGNQLNVTCTNQTSYISDLCNNGKPITYASPTIAIAAPAPGLATDASAVPAPRVATSSTGGGTSLSTGGIIGIIVGVVVAVTLAVLLAVFAVLHQRRRVPKAKTSFKDPIMSHNMGFSRFQDVELS